jgi:HK97 family phage portal protein
MAWWSPATWFRAGDEQKSISLRDLLGVDAASSGMPAVTWQTALQASVVLACARVIAEGMSQIPFRLLRTDGLMREPAVDHPLHALIEWGPNDWQTTPEVFDQIGMHLALMGNAYVLVTRSRGQIVELLPWQPQAVEVTATPSGIRYVLELQDGRRQQVPADDIWHLRGPSWDGVLGLDVVRLARESIGLSLAAERSVTSSMQNGSRLSGILTTEQALSKDQRDHLRESWQASQAGAANAGRIAVMSSGMKFQPMSTSAVDAQQLESRKFQIEEVCRAMRVLPAMVGATDKATTYASAEAMFQAHVTHTLGPWYRRVERSAAKFLLTEQERASGMYFKFSEQGLMRGDTAARSAFYTALFNVGALSPNEIRGLEDMNPYPAGDVWRVPMNMEDPGAEPEPVEAPAPAEPTNQE